MECAGGATCVERKSSDGSSEAICETAAHRRCEAVSSRWCEGTELVHCQPQGMLGKAVAADCAAFGMVCDEHAASGAECVVPGPLTCESRSPKCHGDVLTFCAAGEQLGVSCRDAGFRGCDPDAHGVAAACAGRRVAAAPNPALRGAW